MDNNNFQREENLTKEQKADRAGKDVAEATAKGIGQAYGGKIGGKAIEFASKTKAGQKALERSGKRLSNASPVTRNILSKNQDNIHHSKPIMNSLVGGIGENNSDNNTDNMANLDSDLSSDNETENISGKFSGLGLWNKLSLKNKLIIISVIGGFFLFVIVFLLLFITPLIHLGIIDIGGNNGGLGYPTNTYLKNVYNECRSIVVDGKAWDLEDYVAGVVSAEAYTSEGMEALKAQAIAARTYVIVRTNFCKKPIRNSSYDQNFNSNFKDRAVKAAKATEGLVLTYDSKLFSSEYDSFYRGNGYSCNSNGCSVTYTKLPNKEKHTVSVSSSRTNMIAGGHGRGMSQVASYDLASQGYDFNYILSYFYSPGTKINSLIGSTGYTGGLSASGNFMIRTGRPVKGNSHDDKYYFSDANISYPKYEGQCTWYAYGRANEILDYAGSNLRWTHAPHAKYWFDYNLSSGADAFSYSTNVNEPKKGAIIVWTSGQFGHVAVVEKVNSDGTIDYSEANIGSAKSSSNPHGFRYQSNVSYKNTGVGTISNIWSGYEFVGYIYMVE